MMKRIEYITFDIFTVTLISLCLASFSFIFFVCFFISSEERNFIYSAVARRRD